MKDRITLLRSQGVDLEVLDVHELGKRQRADTDQPPYDLNPVKSMPTHAALVDGKLVGWIGHVGAVREDSGMAARACGLEVIPPYRNRGIGKVLYHLAIQMMVEHGAEFGYECAGICSPMRLILRSVGYRYWYVGFMPMTKSLTSGSSGPRTSRDR